LIRKDTIWQFLQVDLLVNTWNLPLLGHLLDPNLLSCFGSSAFDAQGTHPTTEVQVGTIAIPKIFKSTQLLLLLEWPCTISAMLQQ